MRILSFFICCLTIMGVCLIVQTAQSAVLKNSDVKTYQQIFEAHKKGHYQTAQKLSKNLSNKVLMGYILSDKYLSAKYKTNAKEVNSWLKQYGDLAVAQDMYAFGRSKKMRLTQDKPKEVLYGGKSKACSYVRRDEAIDGILNKTFPYLSGESKKRAQKAIYQLYSLLKDGKTVAAEKLIGSDDIQDTFNQKDIDLARTALAFSYFLQGKDDEAIKQVQKAIKNSGSEIPLAYWTAGLSSWRQEEYADAANYFGTAATHEAGYPILRGSAAFWAARSYLKLGQYDQVGDYLELASQQPRTFYGMMALRMMGDNLDHVWDKAPNPQDDVSVRFSHPALNRFYALKQVGQKEWATKELAKLYLESDEDDREILMMISAKNGFQEELSRLAGTFKGGNERFPVPNWKPQDGWKVDKALVFSFVRQESCFNKWVQSAVGAKGLMQIMPQTGQSIARLVGVPWSAGKMDNEAYNLTLGQNYLLHLMELPAIRYNLIFTAVSYNAGPGNLIKWKSQMQYQNDPLLFIESIPSKETRSFVERIMVNYWVYRSLLGESLNSLDNVISGKWPIYHKNG